mmetsp:Transcript_9242/g.32479  ORF Transcript_9242/g.32479 Transcript_9242/m.32479 type:complete len:339 (-) Transcript_9242:348-1364(-)
MWPRPSAAARFSAPSPRSRSLACCGPAALCSSIRTQQTCMSSEAAPSDSTPAQKASAMVSSPYLIAFESRWSKMMQRSMGSRRSLLTYDAVSPSVGLMTTGRSARVARARISSSRSTSLSRAAYDPKASSTRMPRFTIISMASSTMARMRALSTAPPLPTQSSPIARSRFLISWFVYVSASAPRPPPRPTSPRRWRAAPSRARRAPTRAPPETSPPRPCAPPQSSRSARTRPPQAPRYACALRRRGAYARPAQDLLRRARRPAGADPRPWRARRSSPQGPFRGSRPLQSPPSRWPPSSTRRRSLDSRAPSRPWSAAAPPGASSGPLGPRAATPCGGAR